MTTAPDIARPYPLRSAATDVAFIVLGIFSAAMGLRGFLLSSLAAVPFPDVTADPLLTVQHNINDAAGGMLKRRPLH